MGDTDDFTSWAVSIRFPDAKPIDRVKFQFISGRLLIALIWLQMLWSHSKKPSTSLDLFHLISISTINVLKSGNPISIYNF